MEKNRTLTWSPAAEEDFRAILDYLLLKWGQKAVYEFIQKVEDRLELITNEPQIFPITNKELRIRKSVVTKQNSIYYREFKGNIELIRIFDSRQNPKNLKF